MGTNYLTIFSSFQREGCILNAAYKQIEEDCGCSRSFEDSSGKTKPTCAGVDLGCSTRTLFHILEHQDSWNTTTPQTEEVRRLDQVPCVGTPLIFLFSFFFLSKALDVHGPL